MRRIIFLLIVITLVAALPAAAQIKQPRAKNPDDEGLHYVVLREFARVSEALNQLNSKLLLLEGEVKELRQQSSKVSAEMATLQTSTKDSTAKVSEMQLSSERNLLALNRDLVQVRSDLASLIDLVKRNQQMTMAQPVSEVLQEPVGYVLEATETEVKFAVGAGAVVRQGMRLGVFSAVDQKTQIGILSVIEILDANNAKASIVRKDPGAKFNYSDIVRPIS